MTTDLKKLAEVRRYTYWCRFSHGHNPAEAVSKAWQTWKGLFVLPEAS